MIRGTTPRLEFTLEFNTDLLAEAYVTLAQRRKVVLDKPLKDCGCDGHTLTVDLTQEETLLLDCNCTVEMQIRVRMKDGSAHASDIIAVPVDRILKEGVI